LNKNVQKMRVSGIRRMFEMASTMKNPIDLSAGLPDFDTPQKVKQTAITAIRQGFNRYTPTIGIPPLRKAILKKLKRNKINVKESQVLVTCAGFGALDLVLCALLNQGDEAILFDPYFVGHKQLLLRYGAKIVALPRNKDFSIDLARLEKAVTKKTKVIIVNSPNNPTGKMYGEKELREIARIAKKHGVIIISDELYEVFAYDKKHFSIGSVYKNTVTVNGFSKSHAMTGWRVGYCCGPQAIIDAAIKQQQFSYVCAPAPFQRAAVTALSTSVNKYVKGYKKKRDIIYNGLKDKYDIVKPEGAFYAFVRYPYDVDRFIKNCVKHNLLVVPGDVFSERNTHFRISFATKDSTLRKAVAVLNKLT